MAGSETTSPLRRAASSTIRGRGKRQCALSIPVRAARDGLTWHRGAQARGNLARAIRKSSCRRTSKSVDERATFARRQRGRRPGTMRLRREALTMTTDFPNRRFDDCPACRFESSRSIFLRPWHRNSATRSSRSESSLALALERF